jgi:hypothetical protein
MPSNLRPGHLLAAAGAALVLVSLWLPWYGIDLPDRLPEGMGSAAPTGPGAEMAESFARGLLAAFEQALVVTGWRAFEVTDVVLALGAGAALLAVGALAAGSSLAPAATGRVLACAGVAGTLLIVARLVSPPMPADMLSTRAGAWTGLAGAVLVAVGGMLAAAQSAGQTAPPPPAESLGPWDARTSAPPPIA